MSNAYEYFNYNGQNSLDLHLVRTSSAFFNENITPELNNITLTNSKTGQQFFSHTTYKNLTFTVPFAFEKLSLIEIRKLRQLFGTKEPVPFQLSERPDTTYWVVCKNCSFKYIPFSNGNTDYYNGEGELDLESIYPYGIESQADIELVSNTPFICKSDFKVPCSIKIKFNHLTNAKGDPLVLTDPEWYLTLQQKEYGEAPIKFLSFNGLELKATSIGSGISDLDTGLYIEGATGLIYGMIGDTVNKAHIYNEYVTNNKSIYLYPGNCIIGIQGIKDFNSVKNYTAKINFDLLRR